LSAHDIELLFDPAFEIIEPQETRWPLVFNSPHSGRVYPESFLAASRLGAKALRRSEDAYVDDLFKQAITSAAPLMQAHFPRAYVDLNRDRRELDPKLFSEPLPAGAVASSQSVASGLGVIPRIVSDKAPIYSGQIPLSEGKARLAALYDPYHQALQALLEKTRTKFGIAVLIDCHSMPSSKIFAARRRPDFILGDLKGESCGHSFSDAAEAVLSSQGFSLVRNNPYAGGYITRTYGEPHRGIHALQIEINRSLYMNEGSLKPNRGFLRLVGALEKLAHCLANTALQMKSPMQIAAE